MTTYAVTGVTGHLGRLIVEGLLDAGVPAHDIVAIARGPINRVDDLAARGVTVREGDYSRRETLDSALAGVDTLLLVSSSEHGQRAQQHLAVIDAAKSAGVDRIVYTSLLHANTTELVIAPEHVATEAALRNSGLRYTILRNGWYIENYTSMLKFFVATGELVSAAGDARIAAATRADYAAAAVAVLTSTGHDNAVYELAGTAFTMTDLAAAMTAATGTKVVFRNVAPAELAALLEKTGEDTATAQFMAALDQATSRGALDASDEALTRILGRPSTPLAEVVARQA